MADIQLRLGADVLVLQGPMGTEFMKQGFEADAQMPFSTLNITEPETVLELHQRYHAAGADCGITNTFMATSPRLTESGFLGDVAYINIEGVRLAREAGFTHILGSIGPCGIEVEAGSGIAAVKALDASALSEDEALLAAGWPANFGAAVESYSEAAAALASANVDAILLETFTCIDDAIAAIIAAKRTCDAPVIACMSFTADQLDAETPSQIQDEPQVLTPAKAARLLEAAGATTVGCNCMPIDLCVKAIAQMRSACDLPLAVIPNAGEPSYDKEGNLVWPSSPDDFARASLDLLRAGATLIGACCGADPACISAIYAVVGGVQL
ncbi:MAG: homocysteine S-methyltransferase family protein [Coriobacteriales bacterium]|nr:homocysteine S-methyltransferase family protein [Coriobacteriales bacterium]